LPSPNGYNDFVAAGKMVSDDYSSYTEKSQQELKEFLSKNSEAIKLARRGLTRECRVPLVYSFTDPSFLQNLGKLKAVAFIFTAEGRLAQLENRPADAAESYVSAIRFGLRAGQGGLMIHSLVGVAIEAIGSTPLEKMIPSLDANQCRGVAATLESADAEREPLETMLESERQWSRRAYGWRSRIMGLIHFKALQLSKQRFVSKVTSRQIGTRMLMLKLAARAYELEKGERPKSAADLVPGYLKSIPQDPITHRNIVFP
jgi:hypothetical protein